MLQVSKMDSVSIRPAKIADKNPLSEVQVTVDYKLVKKDYDLMKFDESGEALVIDEASIIDEIIKKYKEKMINQREQFPLPMYDGKCILICTIDKVVPINVRSRQSFGVLELADDSETDLVCKARNPKKLKIESNRMADKQVFKKNMNF